MRVTLAKSGLVLWLTSALAVTTPAAAQQPASPPASPADAGIGSVLTDQTYPLGVSDVVDVVLIGRPDYNTRARIGSDGAINLPLIGPVPAIGKTPEMLAEAIRVALTKGGFFADPQVRVEVVGVVSRQVTVLGQVAAPGLVSLDRSYRLSEILARVGVRAGTGADYVVLKPVKDAAKRYNVAVIATGGPNDDPVVAPGDKIYVPAVESEVFYVSGEVKTPGAFPLTSKMTVRTAIARGGGLTDMGSAGRVKLFRGGKSVPQVTQETTIEPGDVITVGARMF